MQLGETEDGAQPVGQCVMSLQEIGGLSVGQTFDHRALPRRAGGVERGHGELLAGGQQLTHAAVSADPDPAQVVMQIELGIDCPAGCSGAER